MSEGTDSKKKKQKTDGEGGIGSDSDSVIRSLVEFSSVPQTSRLLFTCKELYTAEDVILKKLPVVCDMKYDAYTTNAKLMRAMLAKPKSKLLQWLDTSAVKKLKLFECVTDEEMLIMFGGRRFSELTSLDLSMCSNITEVGLEKVSWSCAKLQSLDLTCCDNIYHDNGHYLTSCQ